MGISFRSIAHVVAPKQSTEDVEAARRGFEDLVSRYGGKDDLSELSKMPLMNYNSLFNAVTQGSYAKPDTGGGMLKGFLVRALNKPLVAAIDPNDDGDITDGVLAGLRHRYLTAARMPDFTPVTLEQYRPAPPIAAVAPQTGAQLSPLSIMGRLLAQLRNR